MLPPETDLSIHDRIDHIEADRVQLRHKADRLSATVARHQAEAMELRQNCRQLEQTLTEVRAMLLHRLADAEADAKSVKNGPAARAIETRLAEARDVMGAFAAITRAHDRG